MRTFALELASENDSRHIPEVVSFVGADESGSFGIMAGHEPLATALAWGLCRFRTRDGKRRYLALPGGVLWFAQGVLHVATRRYLMEDEREGVVERLDRQMAEERESTRTMHEALRNLDRELLQRLLDLPT